MKTLEQIENEVNQNRNPYLKLGFSNRREYLIDLSVEYELPRSVVFGIANILGESEDFDGLLSELENYELFNSLDIMEGMD